MITDRSDMMSNSYANLSVATKAAEMKIEEADIALAKELPEPAPPEISRMEFDMKDQMIRQTILTTQSDIEEMKETLEKIEDKIYNR